MINILNNKDIENSNKNINQSSITYDKGNFYNLNKFSSNFNLLLQTKRLLWPKLFIAFKMSKDSLDFRVLYSGMIN